MISILLAVPASAFVYYFIFRQRFWLIKNRSFDVCTNCMPAGDSGVEVASRGIGRLYVAPTSMIIG